MTNKKNLPYMIVTICFFLALVLFVFGMVTPVDAAASAFWMLP